MTTTQLIILCLTFLLAIGLVAGATVTIVVRRPRSAKIAPPRVGHRATIHMKRPDDQTFYGVIIAEYTDKLFLEDGQLVTPTGTHPLPGQQDIATRDISWIDVHALVSTGDLALATAESEARAS